MIRNNYCFRFNVASRTRTKTRYAWASNLDVLRGSELSESGIILYQYSFWVPDNRRATEPWGTGNDLRLVTAICVDRCLKRLRGVLSNYWPLFKNSDWCIPKSRLIMSSPSTHMASVKPHTMFPRHSTLTETTHLNPRGDWAVGAKHYSGKTAPKVLW